MKEKIQVFCTRYRDGYHDFYLCVNEKEYFLFRQRFSPSVCRYFRNGVRLNEAMDYTKGHRNPKLLKTMSKVPMYIKYLEKERDLPILNQTRKYREQLAGSIGREEKEKISRENVERAA